MNVIRHKNKFVSKQQPIPYVSIYRLPFGLFGVRFVSGKLFYYEIMIRLTVNIRRYEIFIEWELKLVFYHTSLSVSALLETLSIHFMIQFLSNSSSYNSTRYPFFFILPKYSIGGDKHSTVELCGDIIHTLWVWA